MGLSAAARLSETRRRADLYLDGITSWERNMSQEALGGGVFTWNRIQRLYDADPAVHWQRCESEGLECPLEVFTQLFT